MGTHRERLIEAGRLVNEEFGRYKLVEQVGQGGMAEVYLAKSIGAEGLEKTLVIKRIKSEYAEDERFIDMFITEADIAVGLNHPNIVQIYDFGKAEGDYYLAMEYVNGPNLDELLQAGRTAGNLIPIGDAIYVAIEVARGLHYAHQRKDEFGNPLQVVHRDISPQNVLISRDGAVKVVDFGIARATTAAEREGLSGDGSVKGKYRYMSPEQARGETLDGRSDLFSLGVVLFEMLAGQPLFSADSESETMKMVQSAVVPDLSSLERDLPAELERVLYQMLERDPDDRYASARELQVDLTKVLYSLGDIHDAMTLSDHIDEVKSALGKEQISSVGSEVSTAPGGAGTPDHTTADAPEAEAASARANGDQKWMEPSQPSPEQMRVVTRERKEALLIAGRVEGISQLKSTLGEKRRWEQVKEEAARIIDSIAYKNDGQVHHLDSTGFLLALGIPVSSEDDAVRAMAVARDLHEAIDGMNINLPVPLELSIGVSIDRVTVGRTEEMGPRRFEWSMPNKTQNRVEAVADSAPAGETHMTRDVQRRVRRDFKVEPVTQHRDGSMPEDEGRLFRVVGPMTPEDRQKEVRRAYRSFHGRDWQLKVLREQFRESVIDERTGAVVMTGEDGVGKSTLLEEFLSGLDERDVRVVRTPAIPFERDVPMGVLAGLFTELMQLGERSDVRQLRSRLSTRIDALFPEESNDERTRLVQAVADLLNVSISGEAAQGDTGSEKADQTFRSLRRILNRFAQHRPVVIAVDDAHNVDSVSLEFLARFVERRQQVPVFFALTAARQGPHRDTEAWQKLVDADAAVVEELEPLSEAEARRLIRQEVGVAEADAERLVDDIYRLSGGNPLYIKEVVELLREKGALAEPSGWPGLGGSGDGPAWLPSSVEEFLGAKIDRLPLERRSLLRRLSLLWSPFSVEEAALVSHGDPLERLEALVDDGLLERADLSMARRDDEADDVDRETRRYRFANELASEAANRQLMPSEAGRLHGILADYLKRSQASHNGVSHHALLARHLEGAGQTDQAVRHYLEAADSALEQAGAPESLRLAERALDIDGLSRRQEFEAQALRARALTMLGSPDRRYEAIEAMVELAEEAAQQGEESALGVGERVEAYLRFVRFYVDAGDYDEARHYVERVLEEAEDDLGAAEATFYEAAMRMREGDRQGALDHAERAADLYRTDDSTRARRGLARCQNLRGIVLRRAGRHKEALDVYEEALEAAEDIGDSKLTRFLLNNSGLALAYRGRYAEALSRYKQALDRCQQLGHRIDQAEYFINIGHAYYLLGRTDEAISTIRRGIHLARQAGVNTDIANGLVSLGVCYLDRGRLSAADRSLHEGLRIADSIPEAYYGVHAMLALARVQLRHGTQSDAETALVQAEDGLERCRDAQMDWGIPYGLSVKARALNALGRKAEALEASDQATHLLNDLEGYEEQAIWYHHAQILADLPESLREAGWREELTATIDRARELVEERIRYIETKDVEAYLDRPLHQAILEMAREYGS
jgi:serine/threonine protein kinase/tetratricopeptide (TPR) repeat protein/type II secretory pathway predicted ATPase ExeA